MPVQCHFDVFFVFPLCCLECVDDFECGEVVPDGHVSIQIAASCLMTSMILGHVCLKICQESHNSFVVGSVEGRPSHLQP